MSKEIVIREGSEQTFSAHCVRVKEATWRMHPSFHEPYQCGLFSILNLATGQTRDEQVFQGSYLTLGADSYLVLKVTDVSVTLKQKE